MPRVTALSVLDLSPVPSGEQPAQALRNTVDLARLADDLGYRRYWLAEHHGSAGVASSSPELMTAYVASATSRLRVGSGGVMLPNHAPLKVAEVFRVLEAMHPGRIDLGIGRAPGTDMLTALALRGERQERGPEDFPRHLAELLAFLARGFPDDHPYRAVTAIPDGVAPPPVWLLGSSTFSAQLAAGLGLRFAFAHHIDPRFAVEALRLYRERFRPTEELAAPEALLAVSAVCAETAEQAEEVASSLDLAWLRLGQGRHGPLPSVAEARAHRATPAERAHMRANRERHLVGDPQALRARLGALVEAAGVEELMLMTMVHDHAARRRSYELLAAAFGLQPGAEGPRADDAGPRAASAEAHDQRR